MPQQHGIRATSATYTTANGNTGSLTHWARPGIESVSSWILVGFINHRAMMGTPRQSFDWSVSLPLISVRADPVEPLLKFDDWVVCSIYKKDYEVFFFVFVCLFVCFWNLLGIWKFLGQGSNPSRTCSLHHSCGNARSLTQWVSLGLKPAMPQKQAGSLILCTTAGIPHNDIYEKRKSQKFKNYSSYATRSNMINSWKLELKELSIYLAFPLWIIQNNN